MQFKWTDIEKDAFTKIKTEISHVTSLRSPNFDKDFILYTFASNNSLAAVLTQKEEGELNSLFHLWELVCKVLN